MSKGAIRSNETESKKISGNPLVGYFSESYQELKKVRPPTKEEAFEQSKRVVLLIVVFSVILAVLDWVFNGLMARVL